MVKNVIEFPTQAVQGWAVIERTLREIFDKTEASSEFQEEVLARMKEFFERINMKFSVSLDLPDSPHQEDWSAVSSAVGRAFKDYEKQLNNFMNNILLERVLLEIELCRLRHALNNGT